MVSVAMGAAYGSGDDVDSDGAALFVIGKGRGQDLGEGDIAQGLETTSLISRQLLRAPHLGAMPHWWWSWLHSVRASGPSIASTTSNSEISMAGRVRR
jgi:hypothetical protein